MGSWPLCINTIYDSVSKGHISISAALSSPFLHLTAHRTFFTKTIPLSFLSILPLFPNLLSLLRSSLPVASLLSSPLSPRISLHGPPFLCPSPFFPIFLSPPFVQCSLTLSATPEAFPAQPITLPQSCVPPSPPDLIALPRSFFLQHL
jgi:hypothetical protein